MDISQVFIFLCGLEISAADRLSSIMNERDVDSRHREFPKIILSGYREAVANTHSDSNLKLSHFNFGMTAFELRDIHGIWTNNMSNDLFLCLYTVLEGRQSSPERGESSKRNRHMT